MKSITELEQNVTLISDGYKRIYLVGTAHVSRSSAELVERCIREYRPDAVCIELCEPRYTSLKNPNRWRETDIFEVIRSGKLHLLMAQLALASFQKRIAKQFGIKPGEEMHRAMAVTDELKLPLSLVDREVRITLKRAWARAGIWNFAKVAVSFITSFGASDEITEETIEELKAGDGLSAIMSEFADTLPGVKDVLIDERDRYMAQKIADTPGDTLVAVVGAGHVPGIKAQFGNRIDLRELEALPPKSWAQVALTWGVPALLVLLFVYGMFTAGTEKSLKLVGVWAVINGAGAALATLATLPHPLTVITAFVSAPFAAIHPLIAVGWICALVEAMLRKPRVMDFETIADDVTTVRTAWSNRVSKLFLILIFANLGSVIGSLVGFMVAAKIA